MGLLSLLFPKICFGCGRIGDYLCSNCEAKIKLYKSSFCPVCGKASIDSSTHPICKNSQTLDGVFCLFEYKDPLQKILHKIKYSFSTKLSEVFVLPLKRASLPKKLSNFELVALPLNRKRENWRGFNQTDLFGELVAERFDLKIQREVLARKIFEKSQINLGLEERKRNLKGAFAVLNPEKVKGKRLLLFDDVWTSGATMSEAGRTLKRAGAEQVWALCLATSHRVH